MQAMRVVGTPDKQRAKSVEELRSLGFSWADLGEEQYWVDQLVLLRLPVYEELATASRMLWRIFDKTARWLHGKRELYAALSIPDVLWDALDAVPLDAELSRYARFDFSVSVDGRIKLLELNADTPTGYVEAAVATPWMCDRLGVMHKNDGMEQLIREAWTHWEIEAAACVTYGRHLEDSGTVEMLAKHSGRHVRLLDCLELQVDDGVLKDAQGKSIYSLYALYPKEWMGVDEGGEALAYAVESGNVRLLNPIHAVILQSKGLQAVIWGLHELQAPLYTLQEHQAIADYMLPTYNAPVLQGNYVAKAMFGREGGSVRMFDADGILDVSDKDGFDTSAFFDSVFQERAELPLLDFAHGSYHVLTGMFVLNGVPCGLLGRAGGRITGNSSQFVAIGVE